MIVCYVYLFINPTIYGLDYLYLSIYIILPERANILSSRVDTPHQPRNLQTVAAILTIQLYSRLA